MGHDLRFILLLVLLDWATLPINASQSKDDYNSCEGIVKTWSSSSLALEVKEDKHLLQDLLFFLHVPRTGGRTYFHCFLRELYASSLECPRSYDKLRLDPSKPDCRLLTTHDDYSVMSKLHRESTSVVTILRNPVDRVFSSYEFSIEVAARFLVHPNLTSVARTATREPLKRKGVSTLDIWPWKYLVPWMIEDLFARRDIRKHRSQTYTRSNDSYDMDEVVMPLHQYINDPIARDIIHNGATFQIAGLTNNSYLAEAHEIRRCVLKHQVLGEYVLAVAKKRLDNMLHVGLTEEHKQSAAMFANVVGAQVISQLTASNDTSASTVNGNMTVGKLIETYERCMSDLRYRHSKHGAASLKRIPPVNFTKECRRVWRRIEIVFGCEECVAKARSLVPEQILEDIKSLNSLDMKLYKYAQAIFSKQHQQMIQKIAKEEKGENMLKSSNVIGKSQETREAMAYNLLAASAWNNNLWVAMSVALSLLVIALFVHAKRRTFKLKI